MNGVGRVQGLTVQPVLVPIFKLYKNRCVGFFYTKESLILTIMEREFMTAI